jgi:hypothetical protein
MEESTTARRSACPVPGPGARPALRALRKILWIALICWLIATMVPSEGYLGGAYTEFAINRAIAGRGFRLGAWEVQAWTQKIQDAVHRPGADLSPAQQHDLVVAYFAAIDRMDELNGSIVHLYSDPNQRDPKATAAPLQAELDALRAGQRERRPAVEEILQSQVTAMLQANGLLTANHVWPPVLFHFSESPDVLIASPRDRVQIAESAFMQPDAPVVQKESVEGQIEHDLNVSALVDGTGGFATYPTMVVEVGDLRWVLDTIAHEWFHTYLAFRPLGWHYADNGDTRTLNETAATIVGEELGEQALAAYYPERVPPPPRPAIHLASLSGRQAPAPEFSFGAAMRETRLRVDDLLAQGKVHEAEAYMEAQRKVIVSHGYALRKLNQAYFAFHGSYAVGPAATDPIGEKLRALRDRSLSLRSFVEIVRTITSTWQLNATLAQRS